MTDVASGGRWPEDRSVRLAVLWGTGMPVMEIGRLMSITAHSIAHRVRRMGLEPRKVITGESAKTVLRHRRKEQEKALAESGGYTLPVFPPYVPAQPTASFRHCQYPVGSNPHGTLPRYLFCDAAPDRFGSPWCAVHRKVCVVRIRALEEAA